MFGACSSDDWPGLALLDMSGEGFLYSHKRICQKSNKRSYHCTSRLLSSVGEPTMPDVC